MDAASIKLLAAALALLPMAGSAVGLGLIGASWVAGISRNPGAAKTMSTIGFIACGLTEAIGLIALVIALLIMYS